MIILPGLFMSDKDLRGQGTRISRKSRGPNCVYHRETIGGAVTRLMTSNRYAMEAPPNTLYLIPKGKCQKQVSLDFEDPI